MVRPARPWRFLLLGRIALPGERQLKPKQKAQARAAKEKGGYGAGIKKTRELAGG
jgi:hypothetical protein